MDAIKPFIWAALLAIAAGTGTAQGAAETTVAEAAGDLVATDAAPEEQSLTERMILTASETTLEEWLWLKRPLVVFADNAADPRYVEQMQLILDRLEALDTRDVVVITDTDPAARSSVRQKLRARGFMLVIISKDGTIVARKPAPWDVREISRSIDKLPLRQQEIRDNRETLR